MQKMVNGVAVELTEAEISEMERPIDLVPIRLRLMEQVDLQAEAVRHRHISPGAGMAMVYAEKHSQARAVDRLGETAANVLTEAQFIEQFPTLAASVGVEADTLWDCAQLVISKYETFASLSHAIERTRLDAKKALRSATTPEAVQSAYEMVQWPT